MDNLSNELNKLKIDRSQRVETPRGGGVAKYVIGLVIVLLVAAGGLYAWRIVNAAVIVETVRPRVQTSSQSAVLVATGYVIAHHKIQVGSKIAGRVAWIGVAKGDRVKKDQIVVRLEDREYRAQFEEAQSSFQAAEARLKELQNGPRTQEIDRARHEVERAEAQLRNDESTLRRTEGLVKEGVFPAQQLDDAKGRAEASRANLASLNKTYELIRLGTRSEQIDNARSELSRARAAMDYAKSILDSTEIKVPTSGTILERNVEQGEMVTTSFVGDRGAKSFVVTLADLSDIQVELDINQNDFSRISPSQPCNVVTDAFPDRTYQCKVDEIAPEANRQKATVQVKVKFQEPDEFVKPEMNARVTFMSSGPQPEKTQETKLIIVPKRAVVERESGKAVLVVADGKVQSKPITIQREVGTDVVVSAGLTGSESIIIGDRLTQLKVGDRVETKSQR